MKEDNWSFLLASSILIVALTALGLAILQFLGKRVDRIIQSAEHLREARRQQLITLVQIFRWGGNLLIVGSAVLMLLSTFGIDVTPLLASAGVTGLAISLGAQTLIKDLIGGFLILMENQYAVGDCIEIGNVSGQVERLTLRATCLRDVNGRLHVVPNGEARIVSNLTKEWSRALVDVGVAYEEDLDRVLSVLRETAESFAQDLAFGSQILEPPQVLGPLTLGDWAITIRVTVKTRPGKQWEITRELKKQILAACEHEGIALPYPRQEVWVRGPEQDDAQTGDDENGRAST
jgi:small-conductance mechanosensitive channel